MMITSESLTRAIEEEEEEEEEAIKDGRAGVELLRPRLTSWHCCEVALKDWQ